MQPKPLAGNAPKELGKPLAPPTQVTHIRFSPDGKTLAAACFDGKVRRWDMAGKEPAELPALSEHNGWVTDLAFGEQTLFSCDSWGRLSAWQDAKRLWTVETAHDGWLRAIAVNANGSQLATCGKDGFVRLWNAADGKKLKEFEAKTDVLSVCFAADGKSVFAGDLFGKIREFHLTSSKQAITIEVKELHKLDRIQDVGGVKCMMLSGDGKTLFAGGAEPKTGGFVECTPLLVAIDLATGKRASQFKGTNPNEGYVTDLAWHQDGKDGFVIFTTSGQPGQGKFHIWKPGDEKTLFSGGKQPNCHSVALHPDGDKIAVSATNTNSSGNGRVKGTGGEYPANTSPIQMWTLPKL
jgi:YD repeat-containing protein